MGSHIPVQLCGLQGRPGRPPWLHFASWLHSAAHQLLEQMEQMVYALKRSSHCGCEALSC